MASLIFETKNILYQLFFSIHFFVHQYRVSKLALTTWCQ